MAEEKTVPPFNQAWMDTQQQYWEAWGKLARESMGGMTPGTPMPDLTQGLELWWKTVAPLMPEQGREVFQRFVEQGKQYLRFNEQFLKNVQGMGQVPTTPEAWQKFWQQGFSNLQNSIGKMPFGSEQMTGMWNPLLEQWRKTTSGMGAMPDWFNWPANGAGLPGMEDYQKQMERFFSMPGMGYTREWQEQQQSLARLWLEHQTAYREYNEILSHVGTNTIKRFQDKIMALSGSENPVSTLRELYDLWVDCAEDAYAELVNTDEYAQANARLVNTLMAWKQEGRRMVDEISGMMGQPSRRELDSVHKRIHDLRKQHASNDNAALQTELAALRAEVEALKQDALSQETPARKPATRKTAAAAKGE